jgi:hypothetical protein
MATRLYGTDSEQQAATRVYRIKLLAALGRLDEAHAETRALRAMMGRPRRAGLSRTYSDVLAIEADYAALRDTLLPVLAQPGFDRWTIAPTVLARVLLACHHTPTAACPGDLASRLQRTLAQAQYRDNPLNIDPLLSLARLDLARGQPAQAQRRLDEIARLAALPHAQLRPGHRWLAEARLLRGEALAATGALAAAAGEWRAAEALLASRYRADHPLRRQLARHLARSGTARS